MRAVVDAHCAQNEFHTNSLLGSKDLYTYCRKQSNEFYSSKYERCFSGLDNIEVAIIYESVSVFSRI